MSRNEPPCPVCEGPMTGERRGLYWLSLCKACGTPRLDHSPAVGRGRHADRLPRVDAAPPRGGRVARMG